MNQAKKGLLSGTVVYFIGNVSVALLQLIMLRFITGNVSADGYGYYNLIVTVDNLITPILTLQISDAVFRYMIIGDKSQQKSAFTSGMVVILSGIVVTAVGVVIVSLFFYKVEYPVLVILYIVSTNVFAMYQKLARAVGANVEYVKSNLLKAFLYMTLQLFFIYIFHMQVESLFLATILSTFICIARLEWKIRFRDYYDAKVLSKSLLKQMLIFSIPLIPNTILWWLSGSVNSLIVSWKLGLEANGIYSIAGKFAGILSMVASVFNLAWQESAIRQYGSNNAKEFFNDTFEMFVRAIVSGVIVLIPLVFIVMPYMIDKSYYSALKYAPILTVAAGVSALYGFFGQMYAATAKTKGAFTTTVWGVVSNIVIVVCGINWMGMYAPCFATLISAIVISIIRYCAFKYELGLKLPRVGLQLVALLCCVFVAYYSGNWLVNVITLVVMLVAAVVINRGLIQDILMLVWEKVHPTK